MKQIHVSIYVAPYLWLWASSEDGMRDRGKVRIKLAIDYI